MIDRGIVGNISEGADFYVGGPGRTYSEKKLAWTDLGWVGVRLRPGRKLYLSVLLNVRPYPTQTNM